MLTKYSFIRLYSEGVCMHVKNNIEIKQRNTIWWENKCQYSTDKG